MQKKSKNAVFYKQDGSLSGVVTGERFIIF